MDELIQQLTSRLGIDASQAQTITSKLMALVKEHAGSDLFDKIGAAIPGAQESASQASAPSSGGLLGKLTEMASSVLGSSAGNSLGLAASLKDAGVDADKLGDFATTFVNFLKEKLGDDVINQIVAKVPMLKSYLS